MPDVVDRLTSALNTHDLDATMRCYRPDAVAVTPEMELGDPEEIGSFFAQLWQGFPDIHYTVWEKIVSGDAIATEMVGVGTHTGPWLVVGGEVLEATGRAITVRSSWFWCLEDGLIASQRVYYDQLQIYAQLGMRLPLDFEPSR
jgi:ketosteroid isomerase-like protein